MREIAISTLLFIVAASPGYAQDQASPTTPGAPATQTAIVISKDWCEEERAKADRGEKLSESERAAYIQCGRFFSKPSRGGIAPSMKAERFPWGDEWERHIITKMPNDINAEKRS